MKVHAIVAHLEGARWAVTVGATVVQLRVKAGTEEIVKRGRGFRELGVTFVVNDDVEAALELHADGVHLGQSDPGAVRARRAGLLLGRSASTLEQALAVDADYLGVGPIWESPSKDDAEPAIGLDGPALDLRGGLRAGRRDRRHRCAQCRRLHPGGRRRRRRDPRSLRLGAQAGRR